MCTRVHTSLILWLGITRRRTVKDGQRGVHEGEERRDKKEVESSNTSTMEQDKYRNAWVPSQGHKEGGQCVSGCVGTPSQVLGQ